MKHLLAIVLMLVVMGQRWEFVGEYMDIDNKLVLQSTYQLHWVIGEVETNMDCVVHLQFNCRSLHERFTIPDPKTPVRTMTREEAEKVNRGLMR